MKLSHSAAKMYSECPTKWQYHYRQHLRSSTQGAALCFGTAIDKAVAEMLTTSYGEAVVAFEKTWAVQEVQHRQWDLPTHTLIRYADSDFDEDLLSQEDWNTLHVVHNEIAPKERMSYLQGIKKEHGYESFTEDELKFFNNANWLALRAKGILILACMRDEVLPNIEAVHSLQEKAELANSDGDVIVGYVDMVVKWRGIETPVIVDIKTSSIMYEQDSVESSVQLATYTHMLSEKYKTRKAGYVVFNKHIHKNKSKTCKQCGYDGTGKSHRTCDAISTTTKKRCSGEWNIKCDPKASVQIIIADIHLRTEDIVLNNLDSIAAAIKSEVFYRNFDACVKPYGKCPYYALCFKDDKRNLVEIAQVK